MCFSRHLPTMKGRWLASLLIVVSGLLCISPMASGTVPSDWKKVDAEGRFSFFLPPDMEEHPVKGIDSYVGEYRNSDVALSFDYGWWSDSFKYYPSRPQYQEATVEIDGKAAKVITFFRSEHDNPFPYVAAIHFADVGTGPGEGGMITKLTLWADCKSPADQDIAKEIFSSIKFPRPRK